MSLTNDKRKQSTEGTNSSEPQKAHPTGELVVRRHVLPKDLLPRFKEEFATVCKEIMKTLESHIQQKHLSIDEIVNMLCTFRNGDTVFSDDDFIKSTKFCQVSKSVLKRTTIYDYSALEFFINTINCEEAKETLRDFVKHFEISLMKQMNLLDDHEIYTSNDYSGLSFGNDQPLVIKYRGYSLLYDDQELIKKFVCEMFELVDFSVEFERIARGCIALIYRITDSVRRYLLEYRITGGKLASCAKYNILCFIIGDMQLKVPLGYVVTDEDAVVPWTRIIPESPEAHLSELVTEPDDSMHSTFSDSEMVPVTLALHSEEEKLMEPFTTVVGLPYTIGTSFCGGVSPKSIKSFVQEFPVQEFPMQDVCQEITDQTDYGIDSYPVPVSAVPVVVDIDPHPQYDIYSYPVPESVVVVEHPIYKSSSVKNLSMARPVEETEEFLVGNLNLA
ncbi:uncharacterized protein [Dysidea avara]|uniref:uncharacterized protein isoform X2 n=1 Tax=Dysidea avara TaxID=196820 RepID=UPI003321BFEF